MGINGVNNSHKLKLAAAKPGLQRGGTPYQRNLLRAITIYLPKAVTQRTTLPQARFIEGTILFADISGFTSISQKLASEGKVGAEKITSQVNQYFTPMLKIIDEYNGDLLKFAGDALLVLFAGKGHAGRGVQAGEKMENEMERLSSKLKMRIGITSGRVFLAEVGTQKRMELIVSGETVREALSLQDQAPIGSMRIGKRGMGINQGGISTKPEIKLTVPEAIQRLKPYLVEGVYEKLAANPSQVQVIGEHRLATVMFVGLPDLKELIGLGPGKEREIAHILQGFFSELQEIVHGYGGSINKVGVDGEGDRVMILFGAPIAYEKGPQHALRAALEIRKLSQKFKLQSKIGIATGDLFATNVGSPIRMEYTVMGPNVNLAARIKKEAQIGEILISGITFRQVEDITKAEERPPVKLKGIEQAVTLYRVQGLKEAEEELLPLIDREEEMESLQEKIQEALAGKGGLVAIRGEAGIGKSRLVKEALIYAREGKMYILKATCPSHAGILYFPFTTVLKSFFEGEDIEARARELIPDSLRFLPLLSDILPVKIEENEITRSLSAASRKEKLFDLVARLFMAQAQKSPTLLLIEDLHFMDQGSRELLQKMVSQVNGIPLLILTAYRPEFKPEWKEDLSLTLRELSSKDSLKLANHISSGLTPELREVVFKSHGNPLFITEVVKAVLQGVEEVPGSITEVVISRFDRLEDERLKYLLQVAAVVGRELTFPLLDKVFPYLISEGREWLAQSLEKLRRNGFIVQFSFGHDLIHEVIYDSLAFEMRKKLHIEVGEALEELHSDEIDEQVELLAHHFFMGGGRKRAVKYLQMAGDKAKKAYVNQDAISYYKKALTITQDPDILKNLGDVYFDLGEYDQAIASFEEGLTEARDNMQKAALFRRIGGINEKKLDLDKAMSYYNRGKRILQNNKKCAEMAWIWKGIGIIRYRRREYQEALDAFHEGLKAAEGTSERVITADLYVSCGVIYHVEGKINQALGYYQRGLKIYEEINNLLRTGRCYINIGGLYNEIANYAESLVYLDRALKLSQKVEDPVGMVDSFANRGDVYRDIGKYDRAREDFKKAINLGEKIGYHLFTSYCLHSLGIMESDKGNFAEALDYFKQAIKAAEKIGDRAGIAEALKAWGELYYRQGKPEEALEKLKESIDTHKETAIKVYGSLAEAYRAQGKLKQALHYSQKFLKWARAQRDKKRLGMAQRILGEIYTARGDWEKGEECLKKSIRNLKKIGFQIELCRAYKSLGILYGKKSNKAGAKRCLALAQKIYEQISDTIS